MANEGPRGIGPRDGFSTPRYPVLTRTLGPLDIRSDQSHVLDGERWLGQGHDGEPEQDQRAVVTRASVQAELLAAPAAVNEHPFAVSTNGDRDWLHE